MHEKAKGVRIHKLCVLYVLTNSRPCRFQLCLHVASACDVCRLFDGNSADDLQEVA